MIEEMQNQPCVDIINYSKISQMDKEERLMR